MGLFESLERRLQKQDTLGKTLSGNQPLTLTSKLVLSEVEEHELNEPETCFNLYCLIIPSSALINTTRKSQKSMKSSREVSSCALNDKILLGTGLLQSLIVIIFRFHENQIELSADIEGMFLQVVVSCDENRCLRFLLIEKLEQIIKVYEYTQQVSGAKWGKITPRKTKMFSNYPGEIFKVEAPSSSIFCLK